MSELPSGFSRPFLINLCTILLHISIYSHVMLSLELLLYYILYIFQYTFRLSGKITTHAHSGERWSFLNINNKYCFTLLTLCFAVCINLINQCFRTLVEFYDREHRCFVNTVVCSGRTLLWRPEVNLSFDYVTNVLLPNFDRQ